MRRKEAIGDAVKKLKKLIADKKVKEAEAILATVYQAIDKACKTNLIHRNTASRKKSRLAKMLKKIQVK